MHRKLRLMGLEDELLETFNRKRFKICKDVLGKTTVELLSELDIPHPVILDAVRVISLRIAPKPVTISQILHPSDVTSNSDRVLPTKLAVLDAYLRGGIHVGSITEVVGPSGVGKTQFCHMLSVLAVLPRELQGLGDDSTVFYFDSENAFSSRRVADIARFQQPDYCQNEQNVINLIERIIIYNPTTSQQFLDSLESLEEQLISRNVSLIIVDSIAALVRKDFDFLSLTNRQMLLSKVSSILKQYAETFEIPIIITNQVTTQINDRASHITAALGTLWAHCINTRLVFECSNVRYSENTTNQTIRHITIAKSPVSPVVTFPYYITESGIQLLKNDKYSQNEMYSQNDDFDQYIVEIDPNNYWSNAITTNSNQPGGNVSGQHVGMKPKRQDHISNTFL